MTTLIRIAGDFDTAADYLDDHCADLPVDIDASQSNGVLHLRVWAGNWEGSMESLWEVIGPVLDDFEVLGVEDVYTSDTHGGWFRLPQGCDPGTPHKSNPDRWRADHLESIEYGTLCVEVTEYIREKIGTVED